MEIIAAAIYLVLALAGIFCIFVGIPGNFIILVLSSLLAWYLKFEVIELKIIFVLFALAVLGEVAEFVLGIIGSKKRQASNRAIVGSIVFSIVGAIIFAPFLFGIGAVIGAFAGAFLGAFIVEYLRYRDISKAVNSGKGAFLGKLGGVLVKSIIGFIMITTTLVQVL